MTEDFKVHIYPSDCDSVGHVNHAHLLTILERARWSALERHMTYDEYMKTSLWAVPSSSAEHWNTRPMLRSTPAAMNPPTPLNRN